MDPSSRIVRHPWNTRISWFLGVIALVGLALWVELGSARFIAANSAALSPKQSKLTTLLWEMARVVPQEQGALTARERRALAPLALPVMPKPVADAIEGRMLRMNERGEVQVYVMVSAVTDSNVKQLEAAGATIELKSAKRRLVQARVPADRLEAVSALPFVHFVRLPTYGVHFTGSVDAEADSILAMNQVRSSYNVDGTGVRVGVISDGLKGVFATGCTTCQGAAGGPISTGDLPDSTGTRNASGVLTSSSGGISGKSFSANSDLEGLPPVTTPPCGFAGAGAEGTAILEIVHDLAPGAQLFFANFDTDMAFENAVDFLAGTTDVAVDDIGFFGVPYDGTSAVSSNTAAQLNSATNPLRAYFTSVGNAAVGHYLGGYVDSKTDGTTLVGFPGDLHLFQANSTTTDVLDEGASVKDKILMPANAEAVIILTWNDTFGASADDYDLFLVRDSTGQVVGSSRDPQTGTQDPVEFIDYTNNTGAQDFFDIVIQNANNQAAVKTLNLYVFTPECAQAALSPVLSPNHERQNYNTASSSVPAESDAGGSPVSVISVGAIRANDPTDPDHTQIEFFSSQGPTADGRLKPDVTGIDGVSVTGAGSFENPFFGTSAAAPDGAGTAALLLQLAPCLLSGKPGAVDNVTARTAIRDLILNHAVDLGAPGPDDVFGNGRIDALASAAPTIPSPNGVDTVTASGNTPTGGNIALAGIGFSDPNSCPLMFEALSGCTANSSPSTTINCPFGTTTASVLATNNGVTLTAPVNIEVTVTNFSLGVNPSSASVTAGGSAQYTVTLTPQMGAFSGAIALACGSLPPRASCSFSPASVTPGSAAATSTVTVKTAAATTGLIVPFRWPGVPPISLWLLAGAGGMLGLTVGAGKGRRRGAAAGALAMLVVVLALEVACGGGSSSTTTSQPGTPPGTYSILISGTAGSLVHSATASLTVQ